MKKMMFVLIAVAALTFASRLVTVQAEEMAAQESEAVADTVSNEVANELNQMNDVINEAIDEAGNEVMGNDVSGGEAIQ
ncbi:MAG: hypothetical protein JNN05_02195 [Candidatus Omnitrophica bacterium]|nr:hypothetical protein [Candidatus Omnitrophota bacterium]